MTWVTLGRILSSLSYLYQNTTWIVRFIQQHECLPECPRKATKKEKGKYVFFFFSSKFSSVFSNPTLDHLKGYSYLVLQGSGRGKFYLWCQMLLTCLSLLNSIYTELFFFLWSFYSNPFMCSCHVWCISDWAEITNPLREVWFYLFSYSL